MKTNRIALAAIVAAALMTGSAISAYSQPNPAGGMTANVHEMGGYQEDMGPCPGFGPGMHGYGMRGFGRGDLTPEQRQKYHDIVAEYAKKMEPVKDQMFIKRQELRALENAASPDIPAVRAAATELLQLRKQLGQMHEDMTQSLEKEVGPGTAPHPRKGGPAQGKRPHGAAQ